MLDIDKILEKKFSFKKISEIQEHEFQELKLDYNEGFIYFLLSNDFSNEKYIQESSKLSDFIIPNFIKSETILKILDYSIKTNNGSITNKTLDFLRNKFENSKDLFDTFAGLKNSLGFNENELFEFFIGNPPTIHQILKCGDTKSSQEINDLLDQCTLQDRIDYFLDCDEDKNISLDKIIDMESKTNGVKLDNLIFRLKAANDNLKRKNATEETKIKSLKKIKRLAHLINK